MQPPGKLFYNLPVELMDNTGCINRPPITHDAAIALFDMPVRTRLFIYCQADAWLRLTDGERDSVRRQHQFQRFRCGFKLYWNDFTRKPAIQLLSIAPMTWE